VAEKVRCNLCNSDNLRRKIVAKDEHWMIGEKFNIVQCKSCNLAFVNPRPSKEEITKYYPDEYYVDAAEWNIERNSVKELQNRLDYVVKYYAQSRPGKLLDIGIFNGAFVSHVLNAGWDAYGLDPNLKAISLARKLVPGDRLLHGHVESSPFPPGSLDVVTMWEVLEHTEDPVNLLKMVRSLLSPDGIILISVPNFNSLESRIFRQYWIGLDVPRHLYHFGPSTLDKMLEKVGLKTICLETINACEILEFADPITYGRESLRNALIDFGLYPERKRNSKQAEGKDLSGEGRNYNYHPWKKAMFRAAENPLLIIINLVSAAFNTNNTILAIARKTN
jgi:SAM-dependent methyltransferase